MRVLHLIIIVMTLSTLNLCQIQTSIFEELTHSRFSKSNHNFYSRVSSFWIFKRADTELSQVHSFVASSAITNSILSNFAGLRSYLLCNRIAQTSTEQDRTEIKIGLEVQRRDPIILIGYKILIKKEFDFITEINFPVISTLSSSVRYSHNLSRNFVLYFQTGIGVTIFFGPHIEYVFAIGSKANLFRNVIFLFDARVYLIDSNNTTQSYSTGRNRTLNIINYPPINLTFGITF